MQHQGRNVSRMCCRIHRAYMRRKLVFLSLFLHVTKFLPLTISRSNKSMCLYGLGWWLVSVFFFSMAENYYFVTSFKRKVVLIPSPEGSITFIKHKIAFSNKTRNTCWITMLRWSRDDLFWTLSHNFFQNVQTIRMGRNVQKDVANVGTRSNVTLLMDRVKMDAKKENRVQHVKEVRAEQIWALFFFSFSSFHFLAVMNGHINWKYMYLHMKKGLKS